MPSDPEDILFRRLVEQSDDTSILLLDLNGHILSGNRGTVLITGYEPAEIVGRSFTMFFRPEDLPAGRAEQILETARSHGRYEERCWRVRRDGSLFSAEVHIAPLREGRQIVAFCETTRDIGTHPDADDRIHSILKNVIDGIITIDEQGLITTFNPAAEKLFGYTADEVIGRNVRMLMPEPFRSEHDRYIENYRRSGTPRIIGIGREVIGQRKDGSRFPMDLAVGEFRLAGQRYFTGIVRDVTDRKQAEEALRQKEERIRSIVEHVLDGIITIDEHGLITTFNPAAEKLFGYAADEVIGQNVKMLMPEPYHSEHDGYIRNYLETGEAKIIGIGREVVGRRKDGSIFPMELAVSRFHLGDGAFFTGIVRDITERKQLESELRERVEQLADADRRKDEFLAMLAHELRNPLAPIRSGLELLNLVGVQHESLPLMQEQVEHLVSMVDDLLDVSRIMRGKVQLRRQPVDLRTAARRAAEAIRGLVESQQQRLTIRTSPEPVTVAGDPVRLAQIISNLLNNAVKYTEPGGEIRLTVDRDDDRAVLTVQDNGMGIPADLLPRVFDLFAQSDQSLERSRGGLGIGLTLVRSLVELHGGRVAAFSEGPGRGSEFTVWFPITDAPAEAPPTPGGTGAVAARRILIVDDNASAARMLQMLIGMLGNHEIDVVYDGPAAVERARQKKPEVVLLDIGLPHMNGYEVARRLRQEHSRERMLLVAVTGYGSAEDHRRSQEAGFDEHCIKPVSIQMLQRILEHPRLSGA